MPTPQQVIAEQDAALRLQGAGKSREEIAAVMGLSVSGVKRRLSGGRKRARLDPELAARLADRGVTDLAGLHSGWLIEKDNDGAGQSLYFYLGPDQERLDFAEAMQDALCGIDRLPASLPPEPAKNDLANFIASADLHLGGQYGNPAYEATINETIDDLIARLPRAEKAFILSLGDLFDANDHLGVTPGHHNACDVVRDDSLSTAMLGVRVLDRMVQRCLENHDQVELHVLPGNHDPTAYIAALMTMAERHADDPRVDVVLPEQDMEFRVVPWGNCAVFPHHGHTAKWSDLKDAWAELFPIEWANARVHREIWTAHFHHDRSRDLIGAYARHWRTLAAPNKWAREKCLLSRGGMAAVTFHKTKGKRGETVSNLPSVRAV